jgi:NAD(P)-dependent dehydrogenase (short-subunit alcohol dehydrogenase family)
MDDAGVGEKLIEVLRSQGAQAIAAYAGAVFTKRSAFVYFLNVSDARDFEQLRDDISAHGISLTGIVNLRGLGKAATGYDGLTDGTLYSDLYLYKAFAGQLALRGFQLIQVTADAQPVGDSLIDAAAHMRYGFVKALLSEHVFLKITYIDFDRHDVGEACVPAIQHEMFSGEVVRFVAYRRGERFVPRMTTMDTTAARRREVAYRAGGIYVITGGAIGIGYEVARSIAGDVRCTFVMLGRTPLPDRVQWNKLSEADLSESVYERVQNLRALEMLGADVHYMACDLSDREQVAAVFDAIRKISPTIHGVVHAAGVPGDRAALVSLTPGELRNTLGPKVYGTLYMEEHLQHDTLDFYTIFSSLNTLVPQRNTIDYTIANSFLDAYVVSRAKMFKGIQALNWGAWGETGSGVRIDVHSEANQAAGLRAWSTEDGIAAYRLATSLPETNVLIGDVDMQLFTHTPFFVNGNELVRAEQGPAPDMEEDGRRSVESTLHAIWREVLGKKALAINDNFFEMGGHSLIGARLINRIGKNFKIDLSFRDIVMCPTVATLSVHIERRKENDSALSEIIAPLPQAPHYELSHAQKRLWVQDSIDSDQTNYIIPNAAVIDEELDENAFRKALEALVGRHEILRTTFKVIDGVPRQIVNDVPRGFAFSFIDMRNGAGTEQLIRDMAIREATIPFDLRTGPLLRATLIRAGKSRYVFLYTLHHIISDGWSMDIILREFFTLYDAFLKNKPHGLTPLRVQYKDFAAWQNERLRNRMLDASKGYWKDILQDASFSVSLRTDCPRQRNNPQIPVNVYTVAVKEPLVQLIRVYAREHGISHFAIVVAALNVVLYHHSGQDDIIIGAPVAGRGHAELEGQIGFYLNMVPIRTIVNGDDRSVDYIGRSKKTVLDAFEHQDYPFDLMIEEFGLQRERGRNHFFDIEIDYHQFDHLQLDARINFDSLKVNAFQTDVENHAQGKFDLAFLFEESKTGLDVHVTYNKDLFGPETIRRYVLHFEMALAQLLKDPFVRIDDVVAALRAADREAAEAQKLTLKQSRQDALLRMASKKTL